MNSFDLQECLVEKIENLKGEDLVVLEVQENFAVTDFMMIVTGNSSRHVKAMLDLVVYSSKEEKVSIIGVEGRELYEWVLIDLGDVIVNLMQREARKFYDLERLWSEERETEAPKKEKDEDSYSVDRK